MTKRYDIAVIGAGAMGSATAYHASLRGKKTLLLEQFEIGHDRGSSHGNSRIFRLSYDHPVYANLARSALTLWRELEKHAGKELLFTMGGLDLGRADNPHFASCLSSLRKFDLPHEYLDAQQIRRRFPQFLIDDSTEGIFQEDAGILNASECVKTMVEMAAKNGVDVLDNTPVVEIRQEGDEVEVVTKDETYRCKKCVIAAGAWVDRLLSPIGLSLPFTVTKEQFIFLKTKDAGAFKPPKFPIFCEYGFLSEGGDIEMYGFPIFEMEAVKIASHQTGPVVTAEGRSFDLEQENVDKVLDYISQRLPGLTEHVVAGKTCLYTNTPDHDFILDFLPQSPNVLLASTCSGHGFKFAVAIGKIAADLTIDGATNESIDLFKLKRLVAV